MLLQQANWEELKAVPQFEHRYWQSQLYPSPKIAIVGEDTVVNSFSWEAIDWDVDASNTVYAFLA